MNIELFLSFRAILGAIRPVMHGCHSNLCEYRKVHHDPAGVTLVKVQV